MPNEHNRLRRGKCEACEKEVNFQRCHYSHAEAGLGIREAATWTRHYDVCPECGQEQQEGETTSGSA